MFMSQCKPAFRAGVLKFQSNEQIFAYILKLLDAGPYLAPLSQTITIL